MFKRVSSIHWFGIQSSFMSACLIRLTQTSLTPFSRDTPWCYLKIFKLTSLSAPSSNYFVVKCNVCCLVRGSQQWKFCDVYYPFPCLQWNEDLWDWQLSIYYLLRQLTSIKQPPTEGKKPSIPCNYCWSDFCADSEKPHSKPPPYHCKLEITSLRQVD